MKQLVLVVLAFASLITHAQKGDVNHNPMWGASFSPDYSYRTLQDKSSDGFGETLIQSRNKIEIPKLGYTASVNMILPITNIFQLETGLQYSNKGYGNKKQDLIVEMPGPGEPVSIESFYSYQYLGIPVKARLILGKHKLRFHSSVGLVTNWLVVAKTVNHIQYSDGSTDTHQTNNTNNYNKIDISLNLSAGADYALNDKVFLFAEPVFRYGLIKTKDAAVVENLWSAGLNLGVYFRFK